MYKKTITSELLATDRHIMHHRLDKQSLHIPHLINLLQRRPKRSEKKCDLVQCQYTGS